MKTLVPGVLADVVWIRRGARKVRGDGGRSEWVGGWGSAGGGGEKEERKKVVNDFPVCLFREKLLLLLNTFFFSFFKVFPSHQLKCVCVKVALQSTWLHAMQINASKDVLGISKKQCVNPTQSDSWSCELSVTPVSLTIRYKVTHWSCELSVTPVSLTVQHKVTHWS